MQLPIIHSKVLTLKCIAEQKLSKVSLKKVSKDHVENCAQSRKAKRIRRAEHRQNTDRRMSKLLQHHKVTSRTFSAPPANNTPKRYPIDIHSQNFMQAFTKNHTINTKSLSACRCFKDTFALTPTSASSSHFAYNYNFYLSCSAHSLVKLFSPLPTWHFWQSVLDPIRTLHQFSLFL